MRSARQVALTFFASARSKPVQLYKPKGLPCNPARVSEMREHKTVSTRERDFQKGIVNCQSFEPLHLVSIGQNMNVPQSNAYLNTHNELEAQQCHTGRNA
jgi:hypothetical protein